MKAQLCKPFLLKGNFITGWGSNPALNFGENNTVYLQKGKEKLNVNSIFGENCMI
jgi:hypothetical protein